MIKKNYLYVAIILTIVLLLYIYMLNFTGISRNGFFVISSFLINTILSIYFIFTLENSDYSFNKVFWMFNLVFLTVLPLVQYGFDVHPWEEMTDYFDDETYFYTNVYIFLWSICYFAGYKTVFKRRVKYFESSFNAPKMLSSVGLISIYVVTLFFIFAYSYYTKYIAEDSVQSKNLLVITFIKGAEVFGLLTLINQYRLNNNTLLLISLIFLLILYFLFGIYIGGGGRHYLAAVLFGVFFSYFRKLGSQIYFIALLFVALLVFPFLGPIRHGKSIKDISLNIDILSTVGSGDFDAYTMFVNIIKYVEVYSYEYGMQILGSLLFFIPRHLWPDKPIGTGAHVAESFNYFFTNVSAPLVSEAYINFGLLGIIIFGYYLGKIVRIIDHTYWNNIHANRSGYLHLVYPSTMIFFFFMLRGDLLSSYAYIFGFLVSTYLLYVITKKTLY